MLSNYFKIAYRNLVKNKIFSFVNIFGLAIGMSACFFIFQYVHFESSYDRFNKNADRLYRVGISYSATGDFSATNNPAAGPAIKSELPGVENFARLAPSTLFDNGSAISYTDQSGNTRIFNETKIFMADPSFLSMFSFPFLEGNPATALNQHNSVVISMSMGKKYFGKEDPMGKTIYFNGKIPLKISGIFKDVPENSHLKFNMLISFLTLGEKYMYDRWVWPEFLNYILLSPSADPKRIEAQFPMLAHKYMGDLEKELNFKVRFNLQPITDIHLKTNYFGEPEPHGNGKAILMLSFIGAFILVIAWINYINLSTAKSIERSKEVGLRKVIGASAKQLFLQFIFESFLVNILALILASIITYLSFPLFTSIFGFFQNKSILSLITEPGTGFWTILIAVFIFGVFMASAYPALVLSSFKPALALKGQSNRSDANISLRKILVAFQFILSVILIAGAITVYNQLVFMQHNEPGYQKDEIVVVKSPAVRDSTIGYKINAFKTETIKNPHINNITSTSEIPGKALISFNDVWHISKDEKTAINTFFMEVDEHFLPTFNVKLAAGRNLTAEDSSWKYNDSKPMKLMVNENLARQLGYRTNEEALHQYILCRPYGRPVKCEIVGIVKDYHQRSLKELYDPIIYYFPPWNNWGYFSFKINTVDIRQSLKYIETSYKKIFSGNAFEYFYMDDYFKEQYKSDQKFADVFSLFTIIAIFVACLGLLGLSSFIIKVRTKEIGIRKVLGASVYSILVLFSKDFIKLVCIASLIAMPIFYFLADQWLANYAFRIRLHWTIFLLPPLLLMVIALFTISFQSAKAASADPVKSLRSE